MKIILLSGKARNGKDTTAEYLRTRLEQDGNRVLITHYADLLKYICKTFFDWNGVKDDNGRSILQYVGTDTIRGKEPNYWVDFIISILLMFPTDWDYVIIPDCRFPNEVSKMKTVFGNDNVILANVKRLDYTSELSLEQQQHISETAMDKYRADYYISAKTLDGLHHEVDVFIGEMLK